MQSSAKGTVIWIGAALFLLVVLGVVLALAFSGDSDNDGDDDDDSPKKSKVLLKKKKDSSPIAKVAPVRVKKKPPKLKLPAIAPPVGTGIPSGSIPRSLSKSSPLSAPLSDQPWKGPVAAKVAILLWEDFQCGWCQRLQPLLEQIAKAYPNDVRMVWFDFPLAFHRQAMPAAIAGREVYRQKGPKAFWYFHDRVFANQRSIDTASLKRWAKEAGADPVKVGKALSERKHEGFIKASIKLGKRIGVRGTPSIYINGEYFKGARTFSGMKQVIDREIKKADGIIGKKGVTLRGYYDYLRKNPPSHGLFKALGSVPSVPKPSPLKSPFGSSLSKKWNLPVRQSYPVYGPADALVTLMVFGDFQDRYTTWTACLLKHLRKKYPRDLRMVWVNNPYYRNTLGPAAALGAVAALDKKGIVGFWKYHDKVMRLDLCPRSSSTYLWRWPRGKELKTRSDASFQRDIDRALRAVGLSPRRLRPNVAPLSYKRRVENAVKLARGAGNYSPPGIYINGTKYYYTTLFSTLDRYVRTERDNARKVMRQKGVPRSKVYRTIIADGKAPTPRRLFRKLFK